MTEGIATWNPRYTLYAKLHGKSEEDMIKLDRERYPGGCMTGFMAWVQHHLLEYRDAHPEQHVHDVDRRPMYGAFVDHEHVDAWLRKNAKVLA